MTAAGALEGVGIGSAHGPGMWRLRAGLAAVVLACVIAAWWLREAAPAWRSVLGYVVFLAVAGICSTNLRAVQWRPVVGGLALQWLLAGLIVQVPAVYAFFVALSGAIRKFVEFADAGAAFVFGPLVQSDRLEQGLGLEAGGGFIFVVKALPAVIFVSSFFTVLYHLGVLQRVVQLFAWVMVRLMGTSGAESLSATANIFMGQTEAPLIVRPYIAGMTRSELLALMVGGMATIAGGVMVAYVAMLDRIGMGQQAYAILATSVMAAPCALCLSKILLPETGQPQTRGQVRVAVETQHANVIDAAADGAAQGMRLVLNITAMLIAFIAFVALINHLLAAVDAAMGWQQAYGWDKPLSLEIVFGVLFYPVALLLGVPSADIGAAAELLGTKLVLNEFVAYVLLAEKYGGQLEPRSVALLAFALTGFANFASVGIQLGGIGAMAPERRGDLARLGLLALLGGFLATLLNASVAGMLL